MRTLTTTEQKIGIMQAYEDGEDIQYKYQNQKIWHSLKSFPTWDWATCNYRIHPEPPKKVMMQMWRAVHWEELRACQINQPPRRVQWLKVGEPFEYTYTKESK